MADSTNFVFIGFVFAKFLAAPTKDATISVVENSLIFHDLVQASLSVPPIVLAAILPAETPMLTKLPMNGIFMATSRAPQRNYLGLVALKRVTLPVSILPNCSGFNGMPKSSKASPITSLVNSLKEALPSGPAASTNLSATL